MVATAASLVTTRVLGGRDDADVARKISRALGGASTGMIRLLN
jgi:hypothetical protein